MTAGRHRGPVALCSDARRYEAELLSWVKNKHAQLLTSIREKKEINDEVKGVLTKALDEFKSVFVKTVAA